MTSKKKLIEQYNSDNISIRSEDRDRVRKHMGMFMPTIAIYNFIHLVREAKDNSDDESAALKGIKGFEKSKNVYLQFNKETKAINLIDYARGIPLDSLESLTEILWASFKHNKGNDEAYDVAIGMNGVGLKLLLYTSEYFKISTCRLGERLTYEYEDGIRVNVIHEKKVSEDEHGVEIYYVPSDKYLEGLEKVKAKHVEEMLEFKADAFPYVTTIFEVVDGKGKVIKSKKIKGLTLAEATDKYHNITTDRWNIKSKVDLGKDDKTNNCTLDLIFGYDEKATDGSSIMSWCNYINNKEHGSHVDGFLSGLDEFIRKDSAIFTDKDKKNLSIKKEDIRLGLSLSLITTLQDTENKFSSQKKDQVTYTDLEKWIHKETLNFLKKLPDKDKKKFGEIIKTNVETRLASERARSGVKKVAKNISDQRIKNYIQTPITYTGKKREIYIVEGNSAGGQVKKVREPWQEVLYLKGRLDNIWDKSDKEIMKHPLVQEFEKIFGVKAFSKSTNITPRHTKILFLGDADPDGKEIRVGWAVLILRAFKVLFELGIVHSILPPAYSIGTGKNKEFFYSNREYFEYVKTNFKKSNKLYHGSDIIKGKEMVELLFKNEQYVDKINKFANFLNIDPYLAECILSANVLTIDEKTTKVIDKVIKDRYSDSFSVKWDSDEDCMIIEGEKEYDNGDFCNAIIHFDTDILTSKKYKDAIQYVVVNDNVYDYKMDSSVNGLSIYELMLFVDKYKGNNLKRFKGIGQMSEPDLLLTCIDNNTRKEVKLTIDKETYSYDTINNWYSKKPEPTNYRKKFMIEYKYDPLELDT